MHFGSLLSISLRGFPVEKPLISNIEVAVTKKTNTWYFNKYNVFYFFPDLNQNLTVVKHDDTLKVGKPRKREKWKEREKKAQTKKKKCPPSILPISKHCD